MTFRYDFASTPLGEALVVFSDEGLAALEILDDATVPWFLGGVSQRIGHTPRSTPGAADEIAELLDAYFNGLPAPLESVQKDWRCVQGFTRTALQAICEIGWGQTESYGEVAIRAGRPGAARAVGTACRLSPFDLVVPVHRVIRSDGTPGHYGAHPEHKLFLLDLEKTESPVSFSDN